MHSNEIVGLFSIIQTNKCLASSRAVGLFARGFVWEGAAALTIGRNGWSLDGLSHSHPSKYLGHSPLGDSQDDADNNGIAYK